MRARVAAATLVLLAPALPMTPPAHAHHNWKPHRGAAIAYAESRAGSISFAVIGPNGEMTGYRKRVSVPSASVVKAMLMVTYLRMNGVRGRKLRDTDKAMLGPMIRWSSNSAATRIANIVGPARIYRLARDAGMGAFRWTRPWGLSQVNAAQQARFLFRIERYIPRRHEGYARWLLSHIVESQQWGIARLVRPNWTLYFKSGWGSGTGWVCHQVGFFERGDMRIAIAIMIRNSPSHAYGIATLRGIAQRLLDDMPRPHHRLIR